uniref:G_PROTEIN_RECEP_F1_2 domain-containing protein n=1 Tax=Caenorhabditis tropicalis TaxID=1561998 RepID=A0A1I7V2K6_9PELO
MRTSSINVLMIGIATCDLFTMFVMIYKYFQLVDREFPECITSDSLLKVYMDVTAWSLQYHFRRCRCWLEIMMASVRFVIMRRMSDVRNAKLINHKAGFVIIAIIFISSGLLTVTWQYECQVIENRNYSLAVNCAHYQNIYSNPKYSLVLRPLSNMAGEIIVRVYFILDSIVSNFIPSIAFPLLTIFLIREIRKVDEIREVLRRNSVTEESEERNGGLTAKLIVVMTITSFFSEAPLGIIATVKTFLQRTDKML